MFLTQVIVPDSILVNGVRTLAVSLKQDLNLVHKLLTNGPKIQEGYSGCILVKDGKLDRYLFRLEVVRGQVIIIIQTHLPMKVDELIQMGCKCQSKEFSLNFPAGIEFRFRARLNVCHSISLKKGERGVIRGIGGQERQLDWLYERAEKNGFSPRDVSTFDERMLVAIRKNIVDGKEVTKEEKFRSVIFDGFLRVTDPLKFKQVFEEGLGKGKSFGFGLISLFAN